jgi:filamentous hemagglutinin
LVNPQSGEVDPGRLSDAQKQTIVALSQVVGALAGGVASGNLGGANVGASVAENAVVNNRMLTPREVERIKELSEGDQEKQDRYVVAACAEVKCSAEFAEGSEAYNFFFALETEGNKPEYETERDLLSQQTQLVTTLDFRFPQESYVPLFDYTWGDQFLDNVASLNTEWGNPLGRSLGALQMTAGAIVVPPGVGSCAETFGLGCLFAAWGADQAQAGASYVWTGSPAQTFGGLVLSQIPGVTPEAAELLYGAAGIGIGVGASRLATAGAGTPVRVYPLLDDAAKDGISGFTAVESKIINEAQGILSSSEFARLQAAHPAGESVAVNIGGRLIQYEPGLPASGMTMFGENGFLIGREAFVSTQELQQTVLHELHRLTTSQSAAGASGALAAQETKAAADFAARAAGALK